MYSLCDDNSPLMRFDTRQKKKHNFTHIRAMFISVRDLLSINKCQSVGLSEAPSQTKPRK